MFRRFTKRRNHSTLQARQSGNLTFNRRAWPKGLCPPLSRHLARSGGLSLTYAQPATFPLLVLGADCSLWRALVDFGSACDVSIVGAEWLVLRPKLATPGPRWSRWACLVGAC